MKKIFFLGILIISLLVVGKVKAEERIFKLGTGKGEVFQVEFYPSSKEDVDGMEVTFLKKEKNNSISPYILKISILPCLTAPGLVTYSIPIEWRWGENKEISISINGATFQWESRRDKISLKIISKEFYHLSTTKHSRY